MKKITLEWYLTTEDKPEDKESILVLLSTGIIVSCVHHLHKGINYIVDHIEGRKREMTWDNVDGWARIPDKLNNLWKLNWKENGDY